MTKKCFFKYDVKYKSEITNASLSMPNKTKASASKFVKKLKRENRISAHNSKILHGKVFRPYSNIKIKKRKGC